MPSSHNHILDVPAVVIVGTGLLGGSIGLGLRASGYTGRLIGVGRRATTLEQAKQRGCIDTSAADVSHAIDGPALVILATPLGAFEQKLTELAACDLREVVITDVGSTKQRVCDLATRLLPAEARARFVGSHPMAGSERHGPSHADAVLFQGRPCIMTPQATCDPAAASLVASLWRTLGMGVQVMSPAEHDTKVAAISHLPHAVAVLLVELAEQFDGLDVASTGFGDTTRVASGDADVWLGIFQTNRPAMVQVIEALEAKLESLKQRITSQDATAILAQLQHAKQVRDHWCNRTTTTSPMPRKDSDE